MIDELRGQVLSVIVIAGDEVQRHGKRREELSKMPILVWASSID